MINKCIHLFLRYYIMAMKMIPLQIAPLIQLLAILYLAYLAVIKRYRGLAIFFIIFGISAFVARRGYNMIGKQHQTSYATLWYNCDLIEIILCVIGLLFSWI